MGRIFSAKGDKGKKNLDLENRSKKKNAYKLPMAVKTHHLQQHS